MSRRSRRFQLLIAAVGSAAVVAAGLIAVDTTAAATTPVGRRPKVQVEPALPYTVVTPVSASESRPAPVPRGHSSWPAAGAALVSAPALTAQVRDQATAARAGVAGVLFSVARRQAGSSGAQVSLNYSSFANAGGAGFGSRLHLVALPSCALTTPQRPACQVQTPLASTNDTARQTVSATLPTATASRLASRPALAGTAGSAMVLAAVAGAAGSNSDFTATSLAPSGSWTTTGASGSFTWSYPITLPPAAAGADVAPSVALNYNSGAVDGRIASTNNQTSWLGQGWDYAPGFIERTYRSCQDDTTLAKADQLTEQCWAGQILTYSVNGSSNAIVQDDATGAFHLKNDDGSRVQLIGAGSGAYSDEYWKVTAPTGVQYYFGRDTLPGGSTTNATWTMPVCGDSNTKCTGNGNGTISPIETQAWRWNLDYAVDPHGNATAYYYTAEQNYYGQLNKTAPKVYTRGGYLNRIDYGIRATDSTLSSPSDRITFGVSERCTSTCTTFDKTHAANWPDTPQDQDCASTGTCNNHAPTFWSRKRLTAIATYYNNAGTFTKVDSYTLGQSFPTSGDPELELDSIKRTGYNTDGTSIAMPAVSFTYQLLDNRIAGFNSQPAMQMWRLNQVATETGEKILVKYDQSGRSATPCTSTTVPSDPSQDSKECFAVYWAPTGYTKPILDWFHKHMVTEVDVDDALATSPDRYTTYTYLGTPAWHFDDNEVVKPKDRSYGQFRGYQKVQVRVGNPNHASNGVADAWTLSTSTYYRGMDGDVLPNNGTRTATVPDTFGGNVADTDEFAGTVREEQSFNGDTSTEVSATVTTPTIVATTATRNRTDLPALHARMVRTDSVRDYADLAAGGTRQSTKSYDYDSFGRTVHESDTGTGVDPVCSTISYADNTSSWIRSLPSEVIQSGQLCPSGSTAPSNVLSDVRSYYDGSNTLGTVPGDGDLTEADTETSTSHWSVTSSTYDAMGRTLSGTVQAATGDTRVSRTSYTPADGGPLTKQIVTNAKQQTEVSSIDPARGSVLEEIDVAGHKTDASYDALGRLTSVWEPGQVKGADPATRSYSYTYGPSAPLAVTSKTLVDPGNGVAAGYVTSISIYDAFGSLRQTQSAAVGGGRNISDTFIDSHGWVTATNEHWHTTGSPATALITTAQSGIESSTRTVYDGSGRGVLSTVYSGTTAKWSTKTVYSGDRTTVLPPAGGVETTAITDVRGATTELDEWTSAPTISGNVVSGGTANKTSYDYDALGRQVQMITAANDSVHAATWTTQYDLSGRVTQTSDPDDGTTHNYYNDANELIRTVDATGTSLAYGYDALGRQVGKYAGADTTGSELASWTYDTVQAGQLSSSTNYTSTGNYTVSATGYDGAGNLTGTELELSQPDPGFASVYRTSATWTKTHLMASSTPAAGGSLPTETLLYTYDAFGDPTGLTGYNAYVSASSYSPYGEANQYTLGVNNQSAWLTYTRDAQTRRITGVNLSAQTATPQLENLAYTFDASGNVTRSVDTEGGGTGAPIETQCYSYDQLDQLTQAWSATDGCATNPSTANSNATVGGPQPYWLTWTIDSGGSRSQQVRHALPGSTGGDTTTRYNNGVSSPQPHAHALDSSATTGARTSASSYTYDQAGRTHTRTVDGTTQTFSYTPDGQPDTIRTTGAAPQGPVSYSYYADGTELFRRDPTSTTLYLPGEELTRDNGTGTITGTRYYQHNGEVVSLRVGAGNPSYEFSDPQDTAQTVVATTISGTGTPIRRHFDPYGNVLSNADGSTLLGGASWKDSHAFLNQPADQATGLDDLGARTYDPGTGRFLTVDPVLSSSDPLQDNGYSYAENNAASFSDPTGLSGCPWYNPVCFIIGAGEGMASGQSNLPESTRDALGKDGAAKMDLTPVFNWVDTIIAGILHGLASIIPKISFSVPSVPVPVTCIGGGCYAPTQPKTPTVTIDPKKPIDKAIDKVLKPNKKSIIYKISYVVGVVAPAIIPGVAEARGGVAAADGITDTVGVTVLRDGEGATPEQLANSVGGPTGGSRVGQAGVRQKLLDDANGQYKCWRCGKESNNPANMHLGHRNVPTSRGGNLSPDNVCLEGAACNLSAGNRGAPSPGMSCQERGSCGAPYGRSD